LSKQSPFLGYGGSNETGWFDIYNARPDRCIVQYNPAARAGSRPGYDHSNKHANADNLTNSYAQVTSRDAHAVDYSTDKAACLRI
jgi:hypothetical protein